MDGQDVTDGGASSVMLRGVTKRFGDVVAVDSVDLTVAEGEFFSLLGPSGCGKTTTLRMIAGFDFPTSGSLTIQGEEMALRPPNRRPVNTVFQSYALFPHMTIAENVGFGLEMQKVSRSEISSRVDRILEMVQLAHRAKASPSQLSGGQQQRVALARALVNEPKVLLLDEPLGALDLKLRQAMQVELKDLQQRVGVTFIYVTHDQDEALTMSDRIGVMHQGKLLQVGTPEEIYERPASRFVADFIGEINLIPAKAVDAHSIEMRDGQTLAAQTSAPAGSEVTVAIRPERITVHPLGSATPPGTNSIDGTIVRRIYHGDVLFYDVDTAEGEIEVREENRPSIARHEVDDRVTLTWDPEAATVVER